ncbi:MAG: fructosamine kinase family protein [Myxococcales bacterium]|nr:fructosamine kinase family protein [Myxococcales bacterium]
MGDVFRAGAHVIKTQPDPPPDLYPAEAAGLDALAATGVRAPAVRWRDPAGLIIDHLPPGPDDPDDLARQLATLHATPAAAYGWPGPVFIGRFPLGAAPTTTDGRTFWAEHRLRPLWRATRQALGPLADPTARYIDRFDPPLEGPTLIHGDLWNGNVLMTPAGAALIDPSAWHGERAVDLAMMTLFGGFGPRFWQTYRRLCPIPPAVEAALPGYRLYFVLVHVHFFGAGYLDAVRRIIA